MKHTKLLLLPLLFTLMSCTINMGQQPQGSEFVPGQSSVETNSIEYFDGNGQPIEKTNAKRTISFRNNEKLAVKEYTNENLNDIINDVKDDDKVIDGFNLAENVFYGNYGFKLNKQGSQKNNLQIRLKAPVRYIEVVCSPAFLNKLDYQTGENKYISHESAINVNDSKYVKLNAGIDEEKSKDISMSIETIATFDLGDKGSDLINLHCEVYSAVIYEINLY